VYKGCGGAANGGISLTWHERQHHLFNPYAGQTPYDDTDDAPKHTQQAHAEERCKKTVCTWVSFLNLVHSRAESRDPTGMTHNGARFVMQNRPQTQGATVLKARCTEPVVLFFVALAQGLEVQPPDDEGGRDPFTLKDRIRVAEVVKGDLYAFYIDFVRDS
jgi:hypothetical protein